MRTPSAVTSKGPFETRPSRIRKKRRVDSTGVRLRKRHEAMIAEAAGPGRNAPKSASSFTAMFNADAIHERPTCESPDLSADEGDSHAKLYCAEPASSEAALNPAIESPPART